MMKKFATSLFSKKNMAFVICIVIGLLFFISYKWPAETTYDDECPYMYDVYNYWELSHDFGENTGDSFTFKEFPASFRGYTMPFFIFLIRKAAEAIGVKYYNLFAMFGIIILAYLVTTILPSLISGGTKNGLLDKHNIISPCVAYFLIMLFWRECVFLPLTDLYALICIFIAVYLLSDVSKQKILLAGSLLYISYNLRSSYFITVVIIFFISCIIFYKREKFKSIINIIILGIGSTITAIPQIIINYTNSGVLSAKVNYNLTLSILRGGLLMTRYDTVLSGVEKPNCGSVDIVGKKLLEEYGYFDAIPSIGAYIKMVLHNPIQVASVYFKHVINMLDFRFTRIYIKNFNPSNYLFSILNYSLWFIAIVIVINNIRDFNKKTFLELISRYALIVGILLCDCMNFAAHMEIRFFLPIYLIMYSIIVYKPERIKETIIFKKPFLSIAFYLLGLVFCVSIWSQSFIVFIPYYW